MDETIITWNVTNWVTVTVMVFLGMIVIGAAAQAYRAMKPKE